MKAYIFGVFCLFFPSSIKIELVWDDSNENQVFFILQLFRSSIKLKKTFVTRIELFSNRIIKNDRSLFHMIAAIVYFYFENGSNQCIFAQIQNKHDLKRFSHDCWPLFRSILIRK